MKTVKCSNPWMLFVLFCFGGRMGFSLGICEMFVWKTEISNSVFFSFITPETTEWCYKIMYSCKQLQLFKRNTLLAFFTFQGRVRNYFVFIGWQKFCDCGAKESCFSVDYFYFIRPGTCWSVSSILSTCILVYNQTNCSLYTLQLWSWSYRGPPKHQYTPTRLHSVKTPQKTIT
jgi:hypothetical protein